MSVFSGREHNNAIPHQSDMTISADFTFLNIATSDSSNFTNLINFSDFHHIFVKGPLEFESGEVFVISLLVTKNIEIFNFQLF